MKPYSIFKSTKRKIPVISVNEWPTIGSILKHYGRIENVHDIGLGTYGVFAMVANQTVLCDISQIKFERIMPRMSEKEVYFATLATIPRKGECYRMVRYNTGMASVKDWSAEPVISGAFKSVSRVWKDLYYCESTYSAYYIVVKNK